MKRLLATLLMLLICIGSVYATQGDEMSNPQVLIKTSEGDIKVELHQNKVPDTVKNFLTYVDEKHYNNTIFHRVIKNFMIQGGGFSAEFKEKKGLKSPIKNEAMRCAPNTKGTIAMARTSDVHSATAQFYINTVDNAFLNYTNPTPQGFGYCVFGEVVEGMDVVKKIEASPTANKSGHQDVPVKTITILEITRVEK